MNTGRRCGQYQHINPAWLSLFYHMIFNSQCHESFASLAGSSLSAAFSASISCSWMLSRILRQWFSTRWFRPVRPLGLCTVIPVDRKTGMGSWKLCNSAGQALARRLLQDHQIPYAVCCMLKGLVVVVVCGLWFVILVERASLLYFNIFFRFGIFFDIWFPASLLSLLCFSAFLLFPACELLCFSASLLFCFTCFFASLPLRFSVCLSMLFCFFSFSAFCFTLLLCLPAFLLTCFFAFYAFPCYFFLVSHIVDTP